MTAGSGIFAENLLELFVENRGVQANIGGKGTWRTYLTLPNILKVMISNDYIEIDELIEN